MCDFHTHIHDSRSHVGECWWHDGSLSIHYYVRYGISCQSVTSLFCFANLDSWFGSFSWPFAATVRLPHVHDSGAFLPPFCVLDIHLHNQPRYLLNLQSLYSTAFLQNFMSLTAPIVS